MHSLVRVCREVADVNADFHSLRTVLKETENKNKWDFVMFPNDGAMSHLPLIGELVIPPSYPQYPPVLHLFTITRRWNVDVYHSQRYDDNHSTMCFDILRSKQDNGTWESSYTISCLFASLMQALVTPRVPQEYGGEVLEYVSMEKLKGIKRQVHQTYLEHKDRIPGLPVLPTITATSIHAKPFRFTHIRGHKPTKRLDFTGLDVYVSQPISIQGTRPESWSALLDLNHLHPSVVFSVILSNKPGTDLFGNENETILLRNGVTGTAAKKVANEKMLWFYHGKPLNDGNLSVSITVTQDQFTMAYHADGTPHDTFLVHGDTPISKLGKAEIGDVEGMSFYLNIYLKLKSGRPGFINVLDQKGRGYVHGASDPVDLRVPRVESRSDPPLFVKLLLTAEQTMRLQNLLDFYDVGKDFEVQRSIRKPAHQTLIHQNDLPTAQYTTVIKDIYAPLVNQLLEVNVTAIVADNSCVAFLTDPPVSAAGVPVPFYPDDKIPHVTMRLRKRVRPVYSNVLARRVVGNQARGTTTGDTYIRLPQNIKLQCPLKFHYN